MRICLLTDQELDADPFPDDDWPCDPRPFLAEAEWTLATLEKESAVAEVIRLARQDFDLFFNLCSGAWDEGAVGIEVVQTLEQLGVPFTGATSEYYEPSREAMKRVCHAWDVPTPLYAFVRTDEDVERAARTLRFPLFVKHPSSYASNGLTRRSRVDTVEELREQAGICMEQFGSALVEEYIDGTECTVLVAEDAEHPLNPITFTPVQYTFPEGESFKHYDMKWVDYDDMACHPVSDPDLDARLRDVSARFFIGMRGASFGRCDIRVSHDGTPYMLEINPNCGVYLPPTDPGSADLCLLAEPDGHVRFTRLLVDAALARHRCRAPRWEVRPKADGYGVFVLRRSEPGDVLMSFESSPHHLVSRRRVEAEWSPRQKEWFARHAWPLTDEVWVMWSDDPEEWRPVNHSCDPSAWLEGLDVVARRPLAPGDEITLDYATFYVETMPSFTCTCGMDSCRGTIHGDDYLKDFVDEYAGHVSDYVRRERAERSVVPSP